MFILLLSGVTQYLTCSHYRAIEYFTESINIQNCPSRGYPCKDYQTFAKGLCTKCTTCPRMGYSAVEYKDSATGVYYLQTAGKKPFCGKYLFYNLCHNVHSNAYETPITESITVHYSFNKKYFFKHR